MSNIPTIFSGDKSITRDITAAIKSLVTGKTPAEVVKERLIRGGRKAKYVDIYYMARQASLITGWRWSSKCLQEITWPDDKNPQEIGALMEVTLYDQEGKAYFHQAWGSAEVMRFDEKHPRAGQIINIFDNKKAAFSDGIKKCLSYFGIANDIYAGKEPEYFASSDDQELVPVDNNIMRENLDKYIKSKHLRYDRALEVLGVKSLAEVTDYAAAYKALKKYIEGGITA